MQASHSVSKIKRTKPLRSSLSSGLTYGSKPSHRGGVDKRQVDNINK